MSYENKKDGNNGIYCISCFLGCMWGKIRNY
jgi:hypothetical protein